MEVDAAVAADTELVAARYGELLDSVPDAILVINDTGKVVLVNAHLPELFGYATADLVGQPIEILLPERFRAQHHRHRDSFAAEPHLRPMGAGLELFGRRRDGSEFLVEISLSPLVIEGRALVMAVVRDITARDYTRKLEAEIERRSESEARFRQMAENIKDVFFLHDIVNERTLYVSPAYEEIWGRSCDDLYANSSSWLESIHPDDRERAALAYGDLGAGGPFRLEYRVTRPDGASRNIEVRGFPILGPHGQLVRVAGVAKDVTEQVLALRKIEHLNRVYSMTSAINMLIVRAPDREELYRESCRIAVEDGAYLGAWIGTVDASTGECKIVAAHGSAAVHASDIRLTIADGKPESMLPASVALRTGRTIIINDIATDPVMASRRDLIHSGVRAKACLPVIVSSEPVAVVALLADASGVFDEAELRVLEELAGDLAFSLDHLGKREQLDYLAYYDVLTGLANINLFGERLDHFIRDERQVAICQFDLDRFKNINDSLGRAAGDALLTAVGHWLVGAVEDESLVARIGADRFAVLIPDYGARADLASSTAALLSQLTERPFQLDGAVLRMSAKGGVAVYPDDGDTAEALFAKSEAALKRSKSSGEPMLMFQDDMTAAVGERLTLENRLRSAIARGEFLLFYQPKICIATGQLFGCEALIRWNDPRTGLVPPAMFIPLLEETGLIHETGRWALYQAIDDFDAWRGAGLAPTRIAVNVSQLQLRRREFVDEIRDALGANRDLGSALEIEITESMIMADIKNSINTLEAVRAMGVTVALDDFGTGFSSLSHLAQLPIDRLKIDRSFITPLTSSPQGLSLVSTIIGLTHAMKRIAVAEGVETQEQANLLRLLNCDEMQGYLISKPLPASEFVAKFLKV